MRDFFHFSESTINNGLHKLDLSIHDKSKNTFVDNFLNELRSYLDKSNSIHQLSKLPKDTIFSVNELEKEYISCYSDRVHYDIPRDMVDPNIDNIKTYERLQLQDGIYKIINPHNLSK